MSCVYIIVLRFDSSGSNRARNFKSTLCESSDFEIFRTITPWMVRFEVQLLVNHIYNKFRNWDCLMKLLLSENVCSAFPFFVSWTKRCEGSHWSTRNWRENHVSVVTGIQLQRSNLTPVIGHPRESAPITWQIRARRTNHDRELCCR